VLENLETEAYRRAVLGYEEPVYQPGEKVGVVTRYSDNLLMLLLRSRAPQKCGNKLEVNATTTRIVKTYGFDPRMVVRYHDVSDAESDTLFHVVLEPDDTRPALPGE
jgi:hypothetical protein